MKVLLVFLAVLFLNLNCFVYTNDMSRYEKIQVRLKAAAEDCASGAALYFQEEAYGQGEFQIDEQDGEKYIRVFLEEAEQDMRGYLDGSLSGAMDFDEQEVRVSVTYTGKDLFRLPFLQKSTVTRTASYRWEE